MKDIQTLPPEVAERIAAGEVIERPAQVVKELVENALDAGATAIQVMLREGGKERIEVVDNGEGMSPPNLERCILRHATSKIRDLEDLDHIQSMGFRGEALSAICAVSDLRIQTRQKEGPTFQLDAGSLEARLVAAPKAAEIPPEEFFTSHHGTRVIVDSLFGAYPARYKFLRSASTEASQVREILERVALSHPECHFQYVHQGKQVFDWRSESLEERLGKVLKQGQGEPLKHLVETTTFDEMGTARLEVFWAEGLSLPHAKRIYQWVNGRSVKDKLLHQAIMVPFRQRLLPGHAPALALFLEVEPYGLDVNVHPTKSEVRFLEARAIVEWIRKHIESFFKTRNAIPSWNAPDLTPNMTPWHTFKDEPAPSLQRSQPSAPWIKVSETPISMARPQAEQPLFGLKPTTRFIGTLFQTFALLEKDSVLWVMDWHAADERIQFEKKMSAFKNHLLDPQSESLLHPIGVPLDVSREILPLMLESLMRAGFLVDYHQQAFQFTAVPACQPVPHQHFSTLLLKLKDAVERGDTSWDWFFTEDIFEKIAMESCKASVTAGNNPTCQGDAVIQLFETLLTTKNPWNCPHGRPTLRKFNQHYFEKAFMRRAEPGIEVGL